MADRRAERLEEFIKPLRVKPGSKVDLARDFDPDRRDDMAVQTRARKARPPPATVAATPTSGRPSRAGA